MKLTEYYYRKYFCKKFIKDDFINQELYSSLLNWNQIISHLPNLTKKYSSNVFHALQVKRHETIREYQDNIDLNYIKNQQDLRKYIIINLENILNKKLEPILFKDTFVNMNKIAMLWLQWKSFYAWYTYKWLSYIERLKNAPLLAGSLRSKSQKEFLSSQSESLYKILVNFLNSWKHDKAKLWEISLNTIKCFNTRHFSNDDLGTYTFQFANNCIALNIINSLIKLSGYNWIYHWNLDWSMQDIDSLNSFNLQYDKLFEESNP